MRGWIDDGSAGGVSGAAGDAITVEEQVGPGIPSKKMSFALYARDARKMI